MNPRKNRPVVHLVFLTSLMTAQLDKSLKPFEGWKIARTPWDSQGSGAKLLSISFQGTGSAGVPP